MVVRGMTSDTINEFVELNSFKKHPHLFLLEITGPDGLCEKVSR